MLGKWLQLPYMQITGALMRNLAAVAFLLIWLAPQGSQQSPRESHEYRTLISTSDRLIRTNRLNEARSLLDTYAPYPQWIEWSLLSAYASLHQTPTTHGSIELAYHSKCLNSPVLDLSFAADQSIQVVGFDGHCVMLDGKQLFSRAQLPVPAEAISILYRSGDTRLLVGSLIDAQVIWLDGQIIRREPYLDHSLIRKAYFHGGLGLLVLVRDNHVVDVISSSSGSIIHSFRVAPEEVSCIAIASFGPTAVIGYSDGAVEVRSLRGDLLDRRTEHAGSLTRFSISPDGSTFFSGGVDGKLMRWSLAGNPDGYQRLQGPKLITTLESAIVAVSPVLDDETVLIASLAPGVWVCDGRNGGQLLQLGTAGRPRVTSISSSRRSQIIVAGHMDGSISAWGLTRSAILMHRLGALRLHLSRVFVTFARHRGTVRRDYELELDRLPFALWPVKQACQGIVGQMFVDQELLTADLERRLMASHAMSPIEAVIALDDAESIRRSDPHSLRPTTLLALCLSRVGNNDLALEVLSTVPESALNDYHGEGKSYERILVKARILIETGALSDAITLMDGIPMWWPGNYDSFIDALWVEVSMRLR